MRGVGEGHYDWDLKPKTMMTNATVNNAVKDVDGQTVTLAYKGGEKKVAIADTTPIVQLTDATKADVKPARPSSSRPRVKPTARWRRARSLWAWAASRLPCERLQAAAWDPVQASRP